jgi:hypothetical protein
MLEENRRGYLRYTAANSLRLLREVIIHLDGQRWQFVALRLDDLAEQVAQMMEMDGEWQDLVEELRVWSAKIKEIDSGRKQFARNKWQSFLLRFQAKLDRQHGPFAMHLATTEEI